MTSELPLLHPGRLIISWTTAAIFGVCCATPASPCVGQGAGCQFTAALVRGLDEMFAVAVVKVVALSAAWPWMVRLVAFDGFLSTLNWT